tara:strand:+ start:2570 stop:3241 length:672 start_codon:yes stop_codon:yes gene_type:complete
MASRSYTSLAARINPSVPGCSLPMLEQYIRDAAVITCERTLAWRYEQPVFNLTAGVYQYGYNKPVDTTVQTVMYASLNDAPLPAVTLEEATRRYPNWVRASTTDSDIALYGSQPMIFTQLNPNNFIVLPTPDAAATYTVRMIYALKPTRDSEGMDETIMDELEPAIVHKTLQELLVLPGVAWSDRELASYHAKQFITRVSEYRANANLGNMRASVSVAQQPFA